ncbi:MAG: ROK family glucokinase [Trueperella sp.]|nr:ROK family glucokinase [Trueperella sp.]
MLTIGVDVGGTKIAAGVVSPDGKIVEQVRVSTPAHSPQAVADAIITGIAQLRSRHQVSAVGIGAAGFIDNSRTTIMFSPNLNWRNEPLAEIISAAVELPVLLENDANVAAWGEYQFGAAKEFSSAVTVTVGTGIGGGIIYRGELLRGSTGFGAEIGHMNMVPNGVPCGCGQKGCWEMYSSGSAMTRIGREFAAQDPARAGALLEMSGGSIEQISGFMVTQCAKRGDELSLEVYEEIGKWLGQGMADLAALLDPEVFVLAGGVSEAGNILLDPARRQFETRLTARDFRKVPPIVLAELSNDAGIIGAADLARRLPR